MAPLALIGRWQMVRAEFAGAPAPDEVVQQTELCFTATRYSISFNAVETDGGCYESSGETATKSLTLHADTGPNSGRTVRCIFQLVGDRLRICFGLDGLAPVHFATQPDEPRYLATYRRMDDTAPRATHSS